MSSYEWTAGQELETNDGRPCRIIAITPDCQLVWQVHSSSGLWTTFALGIVGVRDLPHHPKPVLRTVDQWCEVYFGGVLCPAAENKISSRIRWTIGTDGKPEYAVRIGDDGEPMYDVVKR